jgi:MbtH protein
MESSDDWYTVVMNDEEQYSLWPDGRRQPHGWTEVGSRGTKEDCLRYIEQHWTDMRPLSLRRAMDGVTG